MDSPSGKSYLCPVICLGNGYQTLRLVLGCIVLTAVSHALRAQNCICPTIDLTVIQGPSCNLVNSGACTVCDSVTLTVSINTADNLPGGGAIRWYSDTDPDFDPKAGEGTLRQVHLIPNVTCNLGNQVKINEFQPWPLLGDNNFSDSTTGEWIEIIGPPGAYVGCYILTDGDWTVTIPPGTVLPPSGLYVIGYSQYGPVDLDLNTCNCSNFGAMNETLVLDNQGEYIALWNGFSYVDAVRYGNPTLANNPPFGNLVTLGQIPTKGLLGCSAQIPIAFPMFTLVNTMPLQDHTFEREPDMTGSWKLEPCGSRGRCNVDLDIGLPYNWTYQVPASECGTTQYLKALIDPIPGICNQGPGGVAAGPFAITVNCPETLINPTLCPGDSLMVNGVVYNQQNPTGTEVFTGFYGCDSLVHIDLQYTPVPQIVLPGDTAICTGDSLEIQMQIQGASPFVITLTADGAPLLTDVTPGVFSFWAHPADTTVYAIAMVEDANGCVHAAGDSMILGVNAPSATMNLDRSLLCLGDTAWLALNLQGGAPFQILVQEGMDTLSFSGGPFTTIPVSPSDSTVYRLLEVTDHIGCPAALGPGDTLIVMAPPTISTLIFDCADDMMTYTIQIGLSGGMGSGYMVTGFPGTFNGAVWTSDPLVSQSAYQLQVGDGGPCAETVLSGLIDCNCMNDPGVLLTNDTLRVCPGDLTSAVFSTDPVLLPGDTLVFLLVTNPQNPLNSLLAASATSGFGRPAGWPAGEVLYLMAAISRTGPNGLDPSDPCFRTTEPLAVIFLDAPTVDFQLPPVLCGEECRDVEIVAGGTPPFTVTVQWGDPASPTGQTLSSMTDTLSVPICGDVFAGDLLFQVTGISDKWCPAPALPSQWIDHVEPVHLTYQDILCQGDSLLLHGRWFHDGHLADTFTLSNPDPTGCDSLVEVNLVHVLPAMYDLQQTLCEGSVFVVGGLTFDESNPSGTAVLAGAAHTGCDSIVNVDLTFTSFVLTMLDSMLCDGDTLMVGSEVFHTGRTSGTVTFQGASHLGCDSLVQVQIGFHPPFMLTLAGGGEICAGDSATLIIQGTPGLYDVVLVGSEGNSWIWQDASPGDSWLIPVQADEIWSLQSAVVQGNTCPVALGGMAVVDVITLLAQAGVTSDYMGAEISCAGTADGQIAVDVTGGSGPFQYQWEDGGAGQIRSGLPAGIYRVTVTNGLGCTAMAETELRDPPVLTFFAAAVTRPCTDGAIRLLSQSGGTGLVSWSAGSSGWQPLGVSPWPLITPGPGVWMLRLRDANGCLADTTLTVPAGGPPILVTAWPDTTVFRGQPVALGFASSVPAVQQAWTPQSGLSCHQCPDPVASPSQTTEYTVRITDEEGCEATASVLVEVVNDADFIYVPNAFSPNFDGINDYFLAFGDETLYKVVRASVYDRWGNLLWETAETTPGDWESGWDGTSRGLMMEPGPYVYMLVIRNLQTGSETSFKGDVQLMR